MQKNSIETICILFTHAGTGHLAAAKALRDAGLEFPGIKIELVDFAKEYKLANFAHQSVSYKFIIKNTPFLQQPIVNFFDLSPSSYVFRGYYRTLAKKNIRKFLQEHKADIYISTYYSDTEIFRLLKEINPKTKTVMIVADIIHTLRLWFSNFIDLIILPTQETYKNGKKYFEKYSDKVEIFGLPVAQNLFQRQDIKTSRTKLELPQLPIIFIAGGGEGMQQIPKILNEIDAKNEGICICVICGKDEKQRKLLNRKKYRNIVKIFGWVENFTDYLYVADIVVTKAGPATIWEAMTVGKKIIIYGFIGGVENGDVQFAIENGCAIFEKNPKKIAQLVPMLLAMPNPKIKKQFKTNWAKQIIERIIS